MRTRASARRSSRGRGDARGTQSPTFGAAHPSQRDYRDAVVRVEAVTSSHRGAACPLSVARRTRPSSRGARGCRRRAATPSFLRFASAFAAATLRCRAERRDISFARAWPVRPRRSRSARLATRFRSSSNALATCFADANDADSRGSADWRSYAAPIHVDSPGRHVGLWEQGKNSQRSSHDAPVARTPSADAAAHLSV